MSLSITAAAAPAPAGPAQGSAPGAGTGSAGSGGAGAFQSLLDALAVLPARRQVPGPPSAVLLDAGAGDGNPGTELPGTAAAPSVLPAAGAAPAAFSYGPGTAAGDGLHAGAGAGAVASAAAADRVAGSGIAAAGGEAVPQLTVPDTAPVEAAVPLLSADAGDEAVPTIPAGPGTGSGLSAAVAAVSPLPVMSGAVGTPLPLTVTAASAAAAAAPATAAGPSAAVAGPLLPGATPATEMAGSGTAPTGRAHPAAAAPSFPLAGTTAAGQTPGAAVSAFQTSAREPAAQPEGITGTTAFSQLPGAAPAVAPSGAPVLQAAAAAAPAVSAAPPQLQAQLAKPVFSLLAAGDGEHVMTLKVTPESLGTVTVRAVIGADGVRLELFAADAGREAVRAVLPDLRRELAGSGFNASLDLGSGSRPDDEPGSEQQRAPAHREAPEQPVTAIRRPDPVPSQPIPDGVSALDILA